MTLYQCANPASWHPTMHCYQNHHHPPLSWRRDMSAAGPTDQSWWQIVPLCGLCHDEYHNLLNAHVRAGCPPPYAVRRTYSLFIQRLVAEAWAARPTTKPPYTESH